jgi:HAD superfamily hydrolase (TIGR01509 family)
MFRDVGISVTENLYESFTGQSTINICRRLVGYFQLDKHPEELVKIKRDHFKYLFDHDDDLNLIPGVLDLIKDFYDNKVVLVVASSASMPNINSIFDRFNLDQYFIGKFSGADLKQSKPHPEIFEKAVRHTGYDKSHCMVVEDSTNGIIAAKSAKIFCVGYKSAHSHGQDYSKADLVISDFKDIQYHKVKSLV